MDYGNEISSSLTFPSTSYLSNGSGFGSGSHLMGASSDPEETDLENLSLNKLSGNLENLVINEEYENYNDAEIVVEGNVVVGVNRCILAARSPYFHQLFRQDLKDGRKPKYLMSEILPFDESCSHDACGPLINYALELMYASATFDTKELVLLVQRHLLNIVEKALIEDVIPVLVAAFHYQLNQLLSQCIERVAKSDLDNVCLEKELPPDVYAKIRSLRLVPEPVESDMVHEKKIKRIHKALDSDDIELLELLLKESNVTLDEAYALHYAVAYCDPKIVSEVLSLGLANVYLKDHRGFTALHVAARRKEPSVLVALLNKGASVTETTLDGRTAVDICRRLTRVKDYNENKKQGAPSNKDRLCIDVLEAKMRCSESENLGVPTQVIAYDLHMKLDYYENRVSFARLLYPAEAKVAMEIADADSNISEADLNESPTSHTRRLHLRLQTLFKTVET
ncbi:BTB/POZ domain and ankyrin repeat-containing protein NPR1 isoform X2 [Gossypium hirsutum]|uniref:BTB/POZ domain and ankyrin repeat-containing protein NPR1 isoform X2 n=1 Tax=Gossypium hirsutum TaxID=3635 RepID=A0ABM2YUG5_GOSHI|nr:BTB/POZ domain and ankyrin repeat-containing protein NPR1-like isoform X2 [Gossypium hirsutum]